ncbi:MAG: 2OG-Fe(II) oxygenase [Halothiobacillaceae bacterium]|nr:2OG-Fe(II) oxygenase [Halothiobacillaceae bacterium]
MNEQNFCNTVINGLAGVGYALVPNAVAPELVAVLRDVALARREQFRPAGIGNQAMRAQAVRGDSIDWLEWGEGAEAVQPFWQAMEALREALNRELYLGVRELECHFALYPSGGGYQKHYDNPQGRSARSVTVLLYLNPDWRPEHGGALHIFDPHDEARVLQVVEPRAGTFVAFLSERFPHEVELARHERLSLTGWWRRG